MKFSLDSIRSSRAARPLRVVVYGNPGVGKSTFAASAPDPVFLLGEDGASHLDVPAMPRPETWLDVLDQIDLLTREVHPYKTLVVDTLDGIEPLCWAHVCKQGCKKDIEDFGYGKGYVAAVEAWRGFLVRLERLQTKANMHLVLVAHGIARDHKEPHLDAFKRWDLKLHNKSADEIAQWVDGVLFATHQIHTRKDGPRTRATATGERILCATPNAGYVAKNRYGLPEELPLDWPVFWSAFQGSQVDPAALRAECAGLVEQLPEPRRERARASLTETTDPAKLLKLRDQLHRTVTNHQPTAA